MSRQASPALVGGFVVGAVALILIGVLSFGNSQFLRETHTFVLYFDESLKGLNVGSPVLFKGVKVGRVSALIVRYDAAAQRITTPVYIELENQIEAIGAESQINHTIELLVKERGLRAQLSMQSLITGQLAVQLDLHPDTKIRLVGGEPRYPEIPTILSTFANLTVSLETLPIQETVAEVRTMVQGINQFIRSEDLKQAVARFNVALDDTSQLVRHVDTKVDPFSDQFSGTADETRATLKQIRETVARLEDRIDATLRAFEKLTNNVNDRVDPLATNLNETLQELRAGVEQAKSTLATLESVVEQDSPLQFRLNAALEELSAAARSVRDLADYLERHPEALIRGKSGSGD